MANQECVKLSPAEIAELKRRYLEGDSEALEVVIRANLAFVHSVARRYTTTSLTYEDLVQAGIQGLIMGLLGYDPDKGYEFLTYAGSWIRQRIGIALEKEDRMIRLPKKIHQRVRKTRELTAKYGELPDEQRRQAGGLTREESRQIKQLDTGSLNRKISHDEESEPIESLIPGLLPDPAVLALQAESRQLALRLIDQLKGERERFIIRARLGFEGDGEIWTLERLGDRYGVTKERIRMIEKHAIRRLKYAALKLRVTAEDLVGGE